MKTLIQGGYVVGYNGKEHIIFENGCVVYENEFINYVGFPNDPKAHYRLGYELLNSGELEKAETYFKGATNLDPYFILAFKDLAYVTSQLNDTKNAIKYYKQALKLDRNDKEEHEK